MAAIDPQIHQLFLKAQALMKSGRPQDGLKLLENQKLHGAALEQSLRMQLNIHVQLKNHAQAVARLEDLIGLRPNDAHYYNELANLQSHFRNYSGAIDAHQRYIARNPRAADSHFNLALAQKSDGQFKAALKSYGTALDLDINKPEEVYLNMAVLYSDHLRQANDAKQALEAALKLNPRYVPALFNLGNLYEELGEKDAARAQYEAILKIDPGFVDALARLGNVSTISGSQDPLVAQMRQAGTAPNLPAVSKAGLYYSLGRLLDNAGAYDEAFETYAHANRISRNSGSRYNRARQETLTDALIETFSVEWFENQTPVSDAAPLFICGMFRSGSTLTEQVLASHPQVEAGGELEFFPRLVAQELAPFPQIMAKVTHEQLKGVADRYQAMLDQLFPGAQLVTDKRPDNFLVLGLIKTLFPNARIINTTRHPLDNCLSVFFLQLSNQLGYASDLLDTGHYLSEYKRLMDHWRTVFGDKLLDFHYDSFVRNPDERLASLLSFCGLPWDDSCLQFHRLDNMVKTASYWQVREPLYSRSSGRWNNYHQQIGPLRDYLVSKGFEI